MIRSTERGTLVGPTDFIVEFLQAAPKPVLFPSEKTYAENVFFSIEQVHPGVPHCRSSDQTAKPSSPDEQQ